MAARHPRVCLAVRTSIGGAGPGADGPLLGQFRNHAHSGSGSRRRREWGSGRRSVTKSWLGGGEEERPQRLLPTLSTSSHPAREEEQFVYLGLQESFPPSSPRPPRPSSLPSLLGAVLPSPAGGTSPPPLPSPISPSPLHAALLLRPAVPSRVERGRGGGRGRCFVLRAAQLGARGRPAGRGTAPAALPPPPCGLASSPCHPRPQRSRPRARRTGDSVLRKNDSHRAWEGGSGQANRKPKTTDTL